MMHTSSVTIRRMRDVKNIEAATGELLAASTSVDCRCSDVQSKISEDTTVLASFSLIKTRPFQLLSPFKEESQGGNNPIVYSVARISCFCLKFCPAAWSVSPAAAHALNFQDGNYHINVAHNQTIEEFKNLRSIPRSLGAL